ncbi:MAG: protein tyrosine phosphatase, partial [Rhizomicrobium sp.]
PDHEIEIALAMRRRAPHASPNTLLVRHADDALGRGGRMVTALTVMGQPLTVAEGVITAFPLADL